MAFAFKDSLEDAHLLLENAGQLAFIRMEGAKARELSGSGAWLFELTVRPTDFSEKPFLKLSNLKYIKARIVGVRLFTTANGPDLGTAAVVPSAEPATADSIRDFQIGSSAGGRSSTTRR